LNLTKGVHITKWAHHSLDKGLKLKPPTKNHIDDIPATKTVCVFLREIKLYAPFASIC